MNRTDDLLAEIFLHDTRSGFQLIELAADSETGFGNYSVPEVLELNFFKQQVEEARKRVEDAGLEAAEGLYEDIAGFRGEFDGEVESTVDKMAACSEVVSDYLSDYSEESHVEVKDLGRQFEEYDASVDYNGLEDFELDVDHGLELAFNTLGFNQE